MKRFEGLDFEGVKLTRAQEKKLNEIFAWLDNEDFSFEMRYGYDMVKDRVLASVAGWLNCYNMPYSPVFRMASDYAWKRYQEEKRK